VREHRGRASTGQEDDQPLPSRRPRFSWPTRAGGPGGARQVTAAAADLGAERDCHGGWWGMRRTMVIHERIMPLDAEQDEPGNAPSMMATKGQRECKEFDRDLGARPSARGRSVTHTRMRKMMLNCADVPQMGNSSDRDSHVTGIRRVSRHHGEVRSFWLQHEFVVDLVTPPRRVRSRQTRPQRSWNS
jgi:hypothetical protein